MFVSDVAIRNPVVTTVVMLALAVFGVISLALLETDEFPEIQPPVVSVAIAYPGASPTIVENEVVDRVEEAVAGISGVKQIQSSAVDGFASLIVEFEFEKDVQQATQDIRDAISGIRADLPPEMEEPVLQRFDPNDLPIVSLALTSTRLDAAALTRLADPRITRELRGVAGVAEVNVVGGLERQLEIQLRPREMAAASVSVSDVVSALQRQNLAAPVGRVVRDQRENAIRLQGRLERPADFERIVVKQAGASAVPLGSVARVVDSAEEQRSASMYNGREAVGIDVLKATGYSTTEVSGQILERVRELEQTLPRDVALRVVRNAGERVEASVNDVEAALVEGAFLTVMVVFVFLNSWRSTIITGLALPVSVLASFISVLAFGFTLNTMSLLGLSLAIGILIDDAIVVRENIVRHVRMGKSHVQASHDATDEIGLAVSATTLSIVVVFIPVAFMGGLAEQWFAPFALTIVASVLVSLFVSFSLDPMLSAYWPDPHKEDHEKARITRLLDRFNNWFEAQAERYAAVIRWALRRRAVVIVVTVLSFVVAMALPALGIIGGAFFPETDDSEFSVTIETEPGSSLAYTMAKARYAGDVARSMPEVAYTYTTIGGVTGQVDEGSVFVRLKPKTQRERGEAEVSDALRSRLQKAVGLSSSIAAGGTQERKPIQIQLRGPDINVLNRLAEELRSEVRQVPGAVDVDLSTSGRRPELNVEVNRGLASNLGIAVADIAAALRPAFAGIDVGDWVDPEGETRDVYVRLAPEERTNPADIAGLPLLVRGPDSRMVTMPLAQVVEITRQLGPAEIEHVDRDRVISVQANTLGRPLSEVMADINPRLDRLKLPPGYRITQGGEVEDQQEVFGRIFTALGVALLLMYFVLVVQFGSFLEPVAILISLPLSLIGVMLALLVTGGTLNIMSLIGVMLLMGIVAKNAILLIDFAKWSEEEGVPRHEAIVNAGRVRLRPILMTSFALIAGMIPVALAVGEGADFRAPMGQAIIGGVITSTLLTLLVIPTIYDILVGWRDRLSGWVRARLKQPDVVKPAPGEAK